MIVFSSGTTGKIKGVQLSHYNIVSNILQMRTSMPSMLEHTTREVFFPPCKAHLKSLRSRVYDDYLLNHTSRLPRVRPRGCSPHRHVDRLLHMCDPGLRPRPVLSEDGRAQSNLGTHCTASCHRTGQLRDRSQIRPVFAEADRDFRGADEEGSTDEVESEIRRGYQGCAG